MERDYSLSEVAALTGISLKALQVRAHRQTLQTVLVFHGKKPERRVTQSVLDSLLSSKQDYQRLEDAFIAHMQTIGLDGKPASDRHIQNLRSYLKLYWAKLGVPPDISKLNADNLLQIFAQLKPDKAKRRFYHATRVHLRKSVITFLVYLINQKQAKPSTLAAVRDIKIKTGHLVQRHTLTLAQVLDAIDRNQAWSGYRSEFEVALLDILVALYAFAGLRKHEATTLRLIDYRADRNRLFVYGKGSVERSVPVFPAMQKHLEEWLRYRPTESPWLVPMEDGTQLTLSTIEKKFQRFNEHITPKSDKGEKIGEPPFRLSPHPLRRSFASTAAIWGMPEVLIQRALGHKHRATTQLYQQITEQDMDTWMHNNPNVFSGLPLIAPPLSPSQAPRPQKPRKQKPVWV